LSIAGARFLEVERFDRVGTRGRQAVISLYALGIEYLGYLDNWTRAALPMVLAPQGANMVERRFTPLPPSADNYAVWSDAARHAIAYWDRLAKLKKLGSGFRKLCGGYRNAVQALAERVPSG
jgi:hypothetical protein